MIRHLAREWLLACGLLTCAVTWCGIGYAQTGPVTMQGPLILAQKLPIVVTDQGTNNNTSGTTLAKTGVTFANAGVAVCVVEEASTIGTVADGTNTYSIPTGGSILNLGSSGYSIAIFVATNATLSSGTITYSKVGTGGATIAILSATNLATSGLVDSAVTNSGTSTNANPPVVSVASGTAALTGELFLACVGGQQNGFSSTGFYTQDTGHGWAAPFATAFSGSGGNTGTIQGGGNQVVTGTGPVTFAPTFSGGSGNRFVGAVVLGLKHS